MFDLRDVRRRVARDEFHPSTTKAVDPVVAEYRCTKRAARRIIQAIVDALSPANYAGSLELANGVLADEYGTMFDDIGWYVKLTVNVSDDEVDVISCHLTRFPLVTEGGTIAAYDPPCD